MMKSNRQEIITIFTIVFMDLFGFGLILPLLPYIAETFHASPTTIGFLTASYSFFQFIIGPIFGRLSDKFGRKKLLLISQFGSAIGFLVLALANSLPVLFISRIIDGVTGGNISIAQAYMADITNNKNRAKGMGVLGAAFGLGFMFGPAVGGYLSQWGFAVPAIFASFMAILTTLATKIFLKETIHTHTSSLVKHQSRFNFKLLQQAPLNHYILTFFFISLGFSGIQSTYALLVETKFGWGPKQVGFIFAMIGIIAIITQLKILPLFIKKWGQQKTLLNNLPTLAFGFALIAFAKHSLMIILGNIFIPLGNSLVNPTITALASEEASKKEYGTTLGFLQSAGSLGRIIGPILASQLFQIFSPSTPFFTSSLIILIMAFYLRYQLTHHSS